MIKCANSDCKNEAKIEILFKDGEFDYYCPRCAAAIELTETGSIEDIKDMAE